MRIDRAGLQTITSRVEAKLKELEAELGITIAVGGRQYASDGSRGAIRIEMTTAGTSPGQESWNRHCERFGLRRDQYGKTFSIGRETYEATSINPAAPKFPIIGKRVSDNRPMKFHAVSVMNAFSAAEFYAKRAAAA